MTEQIEKILDELKAIQAKLSELRDLFWLKIDRYRESDQQRGVAFDEKFEQQRNKRNCFADAQRRQKPCAER
jgi:hypothetical protein